jgi:hypothetical protein
VSLSANRFRTDLALNDWSLGVVMTDDWSIHLGPIDIQREHGKFYDDDLYTKPAARIVRRECERSSHGNGGQHARVLASSSFAAAAVFPPHWCV